MTSAPAWTAPRPAPGSLLGRNRCAHEQPPFHVSARMGPLAIENEVFLGDQTMNTTLSIDQWKLFNAMGKQDAFSLFHTDAWGSGV